MKPFLFHSLLSFFLFYSHASAADVFVALNKSNTAIINEESVLKILKAERLTWDNGNSVVLVIDDLDVTDSKAFDEVVQMSKSQFMEYWRIKFFSGRALIPKQIKSSTNALNILSENKNGIYISIGKEVPKEISENQNIRTMGFKY